MVIPKKVGMAISILFNMYFRNRYVLIRDKLIFSLFRRFLAPAFSDMEFRHGEILAGYFVVCIMFFVFYFFLFTKHKNPPFL